MEPINSLGRRKTSVARVVLSEGDGAVTVNGVDGKEYFPITTQQFKLEQAFMLTGTQGKYDVYRERSNGGGITGQVEAVRLGIARALVAADPETLKPAFKAEELMTRNPCREWSARSSDARRPASATSSASVDIPRLRRTRPCGVQHPIPPDSGTPATALNACKTGKRKVNPITRKKNGTH
jgi:small subunit ribosomal protein S9